MKKILAVAMLALAPAAFANDEAAVAQEDDLLDVDTADAEMRPPWDRRGVAVRCAARGRFGFANGFARGRNHFEACNKAAREAFSRCSGRFFPGPFRACGGHVGTFDERVNDYARRHPGDRARFMGCMKMRCDTVRR